MKKPAKSLQGVHEDFFLLFHTRTLLNVYAIIFRIQISNIILKTSQFQTSFRRGLTSWRALKKSSTSLFSRV